MEPISENPCGSSEIFSDIRKSARFSGNPFRYSKIHPVLRRSFQTFENLSGSPNILLDIRKSAWFSEDPVGYSNIHPVLQRSKRIAALLFFFGWLMDCYAVCAVPALNSMIIHHSGAEMRQPDQIRDARRLLPKNAEVFTNRSLVDA